MLCVPSSQVASQTPMPSDCTAHTSVPPTLLRNCHPAFSAASLTLFPVMGWPGMGRSHAGVCPPGTSPLNEHSPSHMEEQGAAATDANASGTIHPTSAQDQGWLGVRAGPARVPVAPCSLCISGSPARGNERFMRDSGASPALPASSSATTQRQREIGKKKKQVKP